MERAKRLVCSLLPASLETPDIWKSRDLRIIWCTHCVKANWSDYYDVHTTACVQNAFNNTSKANSCIVKPDRLFNTI